MLHEPQFPRAWFAVLRDACLCNLVFAQVHVHGQCMWPKAVPHDPEHRAVVQHELPHCACCHTARACNSEEFRNYLSTFKLLGRQFFYPANSVAGYKSVLPSKNIAG